MSSDPRELLHDAAAGPSSPVDVGRLWRRGRRRRALRMAALATGVALLAGLGSIVAQADIWEGTTLPPAHGDDGKNAAKEDSCRLRYNVIVTMRKPHSHLRWVELGNKLALIHGVEALKEVGPKRVTLDFEVREPQKRLVYVPRWTFDPPDIPSKLLFDIAEIQDGLSVRLGRPPVIYKMDDRDC